MWAYLSFILVKKKKQINCFLYISNYLSLTCNGIYENNCLDCYSGTILTGDSKCEKCFERWFLQ